MYLIKGQLVFGAHMSLTIQLFIFQNNIMETALEVYGCFCSPECALSYLKNEQIDDSTKWERYALIK